MKKFSKILILLVLFVLLPKNVSALLCENADKVKYQEIAKNITYSYDAVEKNGKANFTVVFTNGPSNFALKEPKSGKWYRFKNQTITISNLNANMSYRYDVYYTGDSGCADIPLFTFNIILPSFNSYYDDVICDGIEKFELCHKWVNIGYSYEEWKKKVQAYKDSLKSDEEKMTSNNRKTTLMEKIIEIYADVYYIVLPIVIILGSVVIYVYNKKRELF